MRRSPTHSAVDTIGVANSVHLLKSVLRDDCNVTVMYLKVTSIESVRLGACVRRLVQLLIPIHPMCGYKPYVLWNSITVL